MKLCQLLLYIKTTLNWGLIFTAVSSQQATIISARGQILRWCKILEHQWFHWLSLLLFRKFSINTKEIMPEAQLQGSDLLSWTGSASMGWPVQGDFHLENTSASSTRWASTQRPSLQEHLATHAPYTHCPWSKAKLCMCSRKYPAAGL